MIRIVVDENGVHEVEMTPEEVVAWEAEQASYAPSVPTPKTRLYKSSLIRRMTPSEVATFEGVLASEEPYVRMLYHSVEWFDVADAMVGYMHMVFEQTLGATRAAILLEPEV